MRARTGRPEPLGATWDGAGVNFALYSGKAVKVELCLFDSSPSHQETARLPLNKGEGGIWHAYIEGVGVSQLYGYRVRGPDDPSSGHCFDPENVLFDPYGKAVGRPCSPLAAVIDPGFRWGDDHPPKTPWEKTLIYELHVKGFTKLHPRVPKALQGTYLGLSTPQSISYLKSLGVTAVELLPIQHHHDESSLSGRGLVNYWGYNTLAAFAPDLRYSATGTPGSSVTEFKMMVQTLHAFGIEVILDVVYNHTAEGGPLSPTLSLRGIDNAAYYRLDPHHKQRYLDYTGCGNTLNMPHPMALRLVMDSLRYWAAEMRVDGFRFDLAPVLGREHDHFNPLAPFFETIKKDPILSGVKLIAEPWDLGGGGYQLGNFPAPWSEWNGKYRDTVRKFWKGDEGVLSELATRITGSSDLFEAGGRTPRASVNFITSHDGFTLKDLVSYSEKHNEANGEDNRDGEDPDTSWNCGAEGDSDDKEVLALRAKQQRNFLATLLLSQGVPMLTAGDEFGRSQGGNNNAYCQDNEISWVSWKHDAAGKKLLEFTQKVIKLWKETPVFQSRHFIKGRPIEGLLLKDLVWLDPSGAEMTDESWHTPHGRCLGMMVAGVYLVLMNAHHEIVPFTLPRLDEDDKWESVLDSDEDHQPAKKYEGGSLYPLQGRSLAVLRL